MPWINDSPIVCAWNTLGDSSATLPLSRLSSTVSMWNWSRSARNSNIICTFWWSFWIVLNDKSLWRLLVWCFTLANSGTTRFFSAFTGVDSSQRERCNSSSPKTLTNLANKKKVELLFHLHQTFSGNTALSYLNNSECNLENLNNVAIIWLRVYCSRQKHFDVL